MTAQSDRDITPHRTWLPSLSLAIWLMFFLALNLSNWRQVLVSADGDPCLHWRLGNWMLEHRQIIRADEFSHTRFAAPLITKEWLSELAYAAVGKWLGWSGFVLLAATLISTTLWLLHRQLLAEGADILVATALVLLAALASSHHWLARPHLFTHLLFVVFAWHLRAFERGRLGAGALVGWLIPLMILWVNLHGAFFAGIVLIGLYLVAAGWDWYGAVPAGRRRTLVLAGLLAGCVAATLVNPNGWRLPAHIIEFLREPVLAGYANEFRSPNFHSGGMRGFVLLLLVLGLTLVEVRPRWRLSDLLLTAVWGYFALHSVRNISLFAFVVTPILAEAITQLLPAEGTFARVSKRVRQMHEAADGRMVALVVVVLTVVAVGPTRLVKTDLSPDRFPVAALDWIRAHPAELPGEMFNDYAWGGYLLWALPERRVFVDGRNDFYGAALIKEFDTVDEVRPGWELVLAKYGVGWTLLPRAHPLHQLLERHPRWQPLYVDDVAAIYRMASGSI